MSEKQNRNELPKDWKWETLSDVIGDKGLFVDGDWIESKDQDINGEVRLIQLADIGDGSFKNKSARFLTSKRANEINCTYLCKGDILIARMPDPIGRACIFPLKGADKYVTAVDVAIVRPDKNIIDRKYLLYSINNPTFRNAIENLQSGTTRKRISRKNLATLAFALPPLPIQQAIVSKIEELFSELDKGIEQLKTAQQQLKTYRQAVLKWAFEGKLTEEWRRQNPHLSTGQDLIEQIQEQKEKTAKENRKKTKAAIPFSIDELEELYDIPKQWTWVRNEDYLYEVKDGTHDTPKYQNEGIPFVTQKNIREEGLDLSNVQYISQQDHDKFYQRSNVSRNDIIISMIGHNRGMTAIVDTDEIFSIKNVGLFKFLNSLHSTKFSFYYYQSRIGLNIVLKKSKGGAQPFIGLSELRNWPVPVCGLDEQNQIIQEIETRISVAAKMEQGINQSLQQADALRQSILKNAFEGNLI